jgi:hypothetical protein
MAITNGRRVARALTQLRSRSGAHDAGPPPIEIRPAAPVVPTPPTDHAAHAVQRHRYRFLSVLVGIGGSGLPAAVVLGLAGGHAAIPYAIGVVGSISTAAISAAGVVAARRRPGQRDCP